MSLTQGRLFSITIASAVATVGTSTTLLEQVNAVSTNEKLLAVVTRELEFKEPKVTTEEVKLLGATSGNQNQELDPQSPSKGELTMTLIMCPEDENDLDLQAFKLTATSGLSGTASGYTRYNYASAPPTAGVSILIQSNAGSSKPIVSWLMNNATIENLGGVKVSADGYATQDVNVTAAANDCWIEFDVDGGTA